jgi:hypothetical protein
MTKFGSSYRLSYSSGVTLYQGAPGSKFSKAPLVEMPKARVERRTEGTSRAPYRRHESSAVPKARVERRRAHEFSKGSRACSPGKFLNLESLKCHFPDFRERFNRILMVRKRHCNISELRPPWPMFLLYSLSLGAPIWPIGVGAPGFARSEPIVVTPLL